MEAEKLAREEMKVAQENLNHDYGVALQKLLRKQSQELQSFNEQRLHLRNILKSRYEEERETLQNRSKVVSNKQRDLQRSFMVTPKSTEFYSSSNLHSNGMIKDILLPPLKPPIDPVFTERDRKRKKEIQHQKHHTDKTLIKYNIDGRAYCVNLESSTLRTLSSQSMESSNLSQSQNRDQFSSSGMASLSDNGIIFSRENDIQIDGYNNEENNKSFDDNNNNYQHENQEVEQETTLGIVIDSNFDGMINQINKGENEMKNITK